MADVIAHATFVSAGSSLFENCRDAAFSPLFSHTGLHLSPVYTGHPTRMKAACFVSGLNTLL